VPLQHRIGKAEDQAEAALYLASDKAGYVTGVNLFVDGGWSLTTFLGVERPDK
jgi:meso-butanediol dehydrogenase/(S,S)-butanediol dehydrogenase/diacetyl reductase